MTQDEYLFSTCARFAIADVRVAYDELVRLIDQISPQTANTLVNLHDRLESSGVPWVEGFSIRFPNGLRFTRGWQSKTIESKWKESE
jgi:hypothetical protein